MSIDPSPGRNLTGNVEGSIVFEMLELEITTTSIVKHTTQQNVVNNLNFSSIVTVVFHHTDKNVK